jgi:hypothetical protein
MCILVFVLGDSLPGSKGRQRSGSFMAVCVGATYKFRARYVMIRRRALEYRIYTTLSLVN